MKNLKLSVLLIISPLFVNASIPQTAKVCVFEAAQSRSWSVSCDGKMVDGGNMEKDQTNEMAISQHLSELMDVGFVIRACTGFPNSYGVRCILTK